MGNYVKLVVEWMKDGSAAVVLAREAAGEANVVTKIPLDSDEAHEPQRLRLERSADGAQISGVIVGAYYMRLVGSCSADFGLDSKPANFGLSAHGGKPDAVEVRSATFSKFQSISVMTNRVQWAGGAAANMAELQNSSAPTDPANEGYSAAQAPPLAEDYTPPAPGGWTLSNDLTDEQRSKIAALLAENGMPPL